ncbi:MAG: ligase-associated DNA damage response exonuclease [Candidatus Kapabacteria bacterium]|nr:ligase-associated DNA damage response exonuclease [Candidatus Kapabacteria bacterium]
MLVMTQRGLYCPAADVYVDPVRSVDRAIITHGHSDHARRGMRAYLCHHHTGPILRHRLGGSVQTQGIAYGESVVINGVTISLHPAGHILGSAQVRFEHRGEVWVVTGDYKRQPDPLAQAFEPVRCHTFITETTFGLPVYQWPSSDVATTAINTWWRANADAGLVSVIHAYSLGKAQRVLLGLDLGIGPATADGPVHDMHHMLRQAGHVLPPTPLFTGQHRAIVISSTGANSEIRRYRHRSAGVSGWNVTRGNGFVMSDHVDWPDLMRTIEETSCERVLATHGFSSIVVRHLRERGLQADELHDVVERSDA